LLSQGCSNPQQGVLRLHPPAFLPFALNDDVRTKPGVGDNFLKALPPHSGQICSIDELTGKNSSKILSLEEHL